MHYLSTGSRVFRISNFVLYRRRPSGVRSTPAGPGSTIASEFWDSRRDHCNRAETGRERLEVPESLTALSGGVIESGNINGLEDIGLLVPNLNMSRRADGFPNVSIRGLGGFGNTQGVGFYLDDVQLFSDASARFGDLERIEVLKGPQGILYGGANIGGAVKFVSRRPDP